MKISTSPVYSNLALASLYSFGIAIEVVSNVHSFIYDLSMGSMHKDHAFMMTGTVIRFAQ